MPCRVYDEGGNGNNLFSRSLSKAHRKPDRDRERLLKHEPFFYWCVFFSLSLSFFVSFFLFSRSRVPLLTALLQKDNDIECGRTDVTIKNKRISRIEEKKIKRMRKDQINRASSFSFASFLFPSIFLFHPPTFKYYPEAGLSTVLSSCQCSFDYFIIVDQQKN